MPAKKKKTKKTKTKTKRTRTPSTKKPPVLFTRTQKLVKAIEADLGDTFVSYWTSPAGSVCENDVVGFYGILQTLGPQKHLNLFIKSSGGSGRASLLIVNLLRQYAERMTVCLPLECASAATMIALGADEIRMGPLAYLTAIDTSLTHELSPTDRDNDLVSVSHDELTRVINLWRQEREAGGAGPDAGTNPYSALYPFVHPLVIGAADRVSSLSVKLCTQILGFHMDDAAEAERISNHLNAAYPSHDYPIILDEAREVGLKVSDVPPRTNDLLLELHELYSEMGQPALTDYDESNRHDNEIVNILECDGLQIYFQVDKDWHYRADERRWVSLHDDSSWRRVQKVGRNIERSRLHIR